MVPTRYPLVHVLLRSTSGAEKDLLIKLHLAGDMQLASQTL
jgi:hypothetical protein